MLNPDFPVVSGPYRLTRDWSVHLPGEFNKRLEDDDLVIWRPGFTIWIAAWDNDARHSPQDQLRALKEDIPEDARDLIEEEEPGMRRLRFRLNEEAEDDRVSAYYCFTVGEGGYLQIAMYFDDESAVDMADGIWRSVTRGEVARA